MGTVQNLWEPLQSIGTEELQQKSGVRITDSIEGVYILGKVLLMQSSKNRLREQEVCHAVKEGLRSVPLQ